ncbi:receptor-like serine/threonine-protein kinase SD1-8 [Pistacia vera]|uniref:receptor-like serine/threonine-protein kinase SD1-8 n=1 Tax=Pistacia vera TaxID=55513 RepID=UPI0012634D83|nr:receptor-like serine/threonine-protein kinase SD1-8 [Pistacia vera]
MDVLCLFFISFKLLLFFSGLCYATTDTISSSQSLSEGRTLVSKDQTFELGFFSPGSSKNRYLGIWYKKIPVQTVVWVANRLNPINDSSGMLMINRTGNLVLMSQSTSIVWSANLTKVSSSAVVQLLDSGNLVLRDEQDGNLGTYLWQSFDYPSDTLIAEMKLEWDLKTGFERRISAWRSPDDPSPGDFTWGIELQENPEIIMRKGSTKFYRSGPWNGLGFSGAPELRPNPIFKYKFVSNEEEVYYMFNATKKSAISRIVMNETSNARERFVWNEENQSWKLYASVPRDRCDNYDLCGSYGICILSASPICQCLEGFKSKSLDSMDWSQGCIRNKPLNYSKVDGFIKFDGLKVPDATHSSVNRSMNLKECREKCLENSSCMAYTNSDISGGGSGCTMWFGDLMDMKQFPAGGQDLYIRMSASEKGANDEHKNIQIIVFTTIAAVAVVAVLSLIVGFILSILLLNK